MLWNREKQASKQKLTNTADENNSTSFIITKTRLDSMVFHKSLRIVKITINSYFSGII